MAEYALFVPECWVDTALMTALLLDRREFISHAQGIGNVGRVLRQQPDSRRVVGMVDGDKKFAEQPHLAGFTVVLAGGWDRQQHPHCIARHATQPTHYLIVLHPACDTWLFRVAQEAEISLAALGLPDELTDFVAFCKEPENVDDTKPMRALLRAIQQVLPAAYRELADFVAGVMDLVSRRPA